MQAHRRMSIFAKEKGSRSSRWAWNMQINSALCSDLYEVELSRLLFLLGMRNVPKITDNRFNKCASRKAFCKDWIQKHEETSWSFVF